MRYDFDKPVMRRGTNCYKWDSDCAQDKLPLWVADMDYEVAPCIKAALARRVAHGVFGYNIVPDAYYEAVSRWFETRHGWSGISRDNSLYTSGVVPAIAAILQGLTDKRDSVLVMSPSYNCFYSSIRNAGCRLLESKLINKEGHYEIDWYDLEEKLSVSRVLLLCNPHNPTGRVWSREELERIEELARLNEVFVISDEIHCEFTFSGIRYTPYATVAKNRFYCVCTAASKAFNIAGLQLAHIYCPLKTLRNKIDHQININEVCDVNPFGVDATIAAYTEGGDWIDELNTYIEANYRYLCDYVAEHLPTLQVTHAEGTYLAWINCRAWLTGEVKNSTQLESAISDQVGLLLNAGEMYGSGGKEYMRLNMACTRATLQDALDRMRSYQNTLTR